MDRKDLDTLEARFWVENKILFVQYKEGLNLEISTAKEIVANRLAFQNSVVYPLVADCIGIKSASREARDYIAKEGSVQLNSCAIIFTSMVFKTIGNFYLAINKPLIPTKLFNDQEDALTWIKRFILK